MNQMHKAIFISLLTTALLASASMARAQDGASSQQPDDQAAQSTQSARPKAIEYSDGYEMRAKIHRYASWATLPLFATEFALGQSIYTDPNARTSGKKNAHIAVGTGITGLFAVNSVTGIWNLWESRHDPAHHKLKLVHGILMLGADAGFVTTFASGPGSHLSDANLDSQKQKHRAIALTSIGVATGSYLLMLFGNK